MRTDMGVYEVALTGTEGLMKAKVAARRKKLTSLDSLTARGRHTPTILQTVFQGMQITSLMASRNFCKFYVRKRPDLMPAEWMG
jgi:hypothetical protein